MQYQASTIPKNSSDILTFLNRRKRYSRKQSRKDKETK